MTDELDELLEKLEELADVLITGVELRGVLLPPPPPPQAAKGKTKKIQRRLTPTGRNRAARV